MRHRSQWATAVAGALCCLSALAAPAQSVPDKSVFLLLDTSGSMSGAGMSMAKTAMGVLLDEMKSDNEYRLALIKGSSENVVVPMGRNNTEAIRAQIDFGGRDGNPTTDLQLFANNVLPSSSGCAMVLLVTDGDDGKNPVDAARSIRSQCSKLFVVGVGLGASSEAVLSNIAAVGGGRYCNGSDASSLTRCVLSAFKRFQFNETFGYCTDSNGVPGINPMPKLERLARMNDWDCYDFSGQDFTPGGHIQQQTWSAFDNGRLQRTVRGSNFTGANFSKGGIDASFSGARFHRANFEYATIYGTSVERVDFTAANLRNGSFSSKGKTCNRDWDLTGASLDGASFHDFKACDFKLSGTISVPSLHDVEFRGLRVDKGLIFSGARGQNVKIAGASGKGLAFELGNIDELQLENLELETFTVSGTGNSQSPGSLSIRKASVSTSFIVTKSRFSELTASELSTPRLSLSDITGAVVVTDSAPAETSVSMANVEFRDTKIVKGTFKAFERLAFNDSSRCDNCSLAYKANAHLTIDSASLPKMTLQPMQTTDGLFMEARNADMSGALWTNVLWKADSSLEKVRLNGATFTSTDLSLVMVNVDISESTFTGSWIILVDGSEHVECRRCGKLAVGFKTANFSRLRLPGTEVVFSKRFGWNDLEIIGLDVSQGSLAGVGGLHGLVCRECRFEDAKLDGSFDGLTLLKPQADRTRFRNISAYDKEGITIIGGSFRAATFKNDYVDAHATLKGTFDKADFTDATFDVPVKGEISSSLFVRAKFQHGITESEVLHSDFSQASFPDLSKGLRKSTFVRTKFTGAVFADSFEHSDHPVFESCWFDGPYGRANIKQLLKGAPGIRVSNAIWAGADLSGINQSKVELESVDLRGARLIGTGLSQVKLENINLTDADLSGASLEGEISNSSLHGATVSDTHIGGTLTGVDLSNLIDAERMSSLSANLEDVNLAGTDIHNVHSEFENHVVRRLTLNDAVIPCQLQEQIIKQNTVTYGGYRAQPWDALSGTCKDYASGL